MRASNTSSEFVLTYRRTNINQEKTFFNTKEDTFFQFWFNLDFFMRLACFYLPLCASSLRACLLVGELVCSLSGYSLFRELLEAQTFALDKSGHLAPVWKCWLWWLNVMFFCACVRNYAYLSASSMGVAYRDRETERRPEIWLDASLLIKALPNVPPSQSCLCLTL